MQLHVIVFPGELLLLVLGFGDKVLGRYIPYRNGTLHPSGRIRIECRVLDGRSGGGY